MRSNPFAHRFRKLRMIHRKGSPTLSQSVLMPCSGNRRRPVRHHRRQSRGDRVRCRLASTVKTESRHRDEILPKLAQSRRAEHRRRARGDRLPSGESGDGAGRSRYGAHQGLETAPASARPGRSSEAAAARTRTRYFSSALSTYSKPVELPVPVHHAYRRATRHSPQWGIGNGVAQPSHRPVSGA